MAYDDEQQEWDSGPYCRHWGDPIDCDKICVCGHECCKHNWYIEGCIECEKAGRTCVEFKDAPNR